MNVKDKLEYFSKAAIEEADGKRREILAGMEEEYNAACKEAEARFRKKAEAEYADESNRAEQKRNREVLRVGQEAKLAFIELRNRRIGEVFERVERLILEYVGTEEYLLKLNYGIAALSMDYAGETNEIEIILESRDIGALAGRKLPPRLKLTASGEGEVLGGFRAVIAARRVIIDNTYRTRLADARAEFKGFR